MYLQAGGLFNVNSKRIVGMSNGVGYEDVVHLRQLNELKTWVINNSLIKNKYY